MSNIGYIVRGRDIGKRSVNGSTKYIWYACEICGKERWVQLHKGKPCNSRCHSCAQFASGNSNWKGGNAGMSACWVRARSWFKREPCVKCGKKAETHHIDGNPLNNNPDNIIFLCRKHHMEADGRMIKRDGKGKFCGNRFDKQVEIERMPTM